MFPQKAVYLLVTERIQVSSIESRENLEFENLAKPPLYSHTFRGLY